MRHLLQKQDKVSRLEEALDDINTKETREIFLDCMRPDVNPERLQILQQSKVALDEYGKSSTSCPSKSCNHLICAGLSES